MAHLFRLIVGLALCWCGAASALVPLVTTNGFRIAAGTDTSIFPTRQAACDAQTVAWANGWTTVAKQVLNPSSQLDPNGVNCRHSSSAGTSVIFVISAASATACPANSAPSGSACACSTGYEEGGAGGANAGKCVLKPSPCERLKGAIVGGVEWATPTRANFNGCVGGVGEDAMCKTVAVCDFSEKAAGSATYNCRGNSYVTGQQSTACTGDGGTPATPAPLPVKDPANPNAPPTPDKPVPARCPEGLVAGVFNGNTLCVQPGSGSEVAADAPGNGSRTTNNSDGSSSTATQTGTTKCTADKCTTDATTTTVGLNKPGDTACPAGATAGTATNSSGATVTSCTSVSTGSSTGTLGEFCKANAKSVLCNGQGEQGSFGGDCKGGYKATGDDAVLNAMAQEQFKRNCEMFEIKPEPTDETKAYDAMKAKGTTGGDQTGDLPADSKRSVSIGPSDFDSTSAIAMASCIADLTVNFQGSSLTLPFSNICKYLEYIGTLLTVVAYLLAARIVLRG